MKIMLVCTSGGHFATMSSLKKFWSIHDRVWVTDYKQDTRCLADTENVFWLPYQGPRKILPFLRNIIPAIRLVKQEKPDLVISTGASIAFTFALASKVLGAHFMYIESPSRSSKLSVSGKLVYPICSEFYVQSPKLARKYAKAVFAGYI